MKVIIRCDALTQIGTGHVMRCLTLVNELREQGADLAIGAGGSTTWERCCMGLPVIGMSIANNQQSGCKTLARSGDVFCLGESKDVGIELLKEALKVALASSDLLVGMSEAGTTLVDGHGAQRVGRQLATNQVDLRSPLFTEGTFFGA